MESPQNFSITLQALAWGLFHPLYRLQLPLKASLLPTLYFLFALEHWKSFTSRAPSFSSFSFFFLFSSIKDKKNVFTFILHVSLNTCWVCICMHSCNDTHVDVRTNCGSQFSPLPSVSGDWTQVVWWQVTEPPDCSVDSEPPHCSVGFDILEM